MRINPLIALLAAALTLTAAPALAQSDDPGQTEANGCQVFVGAGSGQIVSDWGEEPLTAVGILHLTRRADGQQSTLEFESVFFPGVDAGDDGLREHRGFDNWRFIENGTRGTFRIRIELTPDDPTAPLTLGLVADGELIGGNLYRTGGMHWVGTMDYYSGAYEISLFEMVVCRNQ